jgi:SulP family sulfate permease
MPLLRRSNQSRTDQVHDAVRLEACEETIIESYSGATGQAHSLRSWLSQALASADYADRLANRCRRIEVKAGDIIARQGDAADAMHFVLEGRVGIVVDFDDGRSIRVRSLGRHTTIGEMGLIAKRPRSATIQAEIDGVLSSYPPKLTRRSSATIRHWPRLC